MRQSIIILIYTIFAELFIAIGWFASKKDWQKLRMCLQKLWMCLQKLWMCLVVALIGLPLGWVVGLSISPVLQTVITSLVAVVASGVAILSRISSADKSESTGSKKNSGSTEQEPPSPKAEPDGSKKNSGSTKKKPSSLKKVEPLLKEIDPLPIAALMLAFAIGSTLGVYYRANGMFGTDPEVIVERWKKVGLDDKEVAQAVFRSMYPSVNSKNDKNDGKAIAEKAGLGVLFSFEPEVDEELKKSKWLPDEELARHLAAVGDMRIQDLAQKYANRPDILRALVEVLTWKSEEKQ